MLVNENKTNADCHTIYKRYINMKMLTITWLIKMLNENAWYKRYTNVKMLRLLLNKSIQWQHMAAMSAKL